MEVRPVIISACLMGINTRYDGTSSFNAEAVKEAGPWPLPVCPEQLGGLQTPRPTAEITQGTGDDVLKGMASVVDQKSMDVTASFVSGAEAVVKIARLTGTLKAVLKERSPSCGVSAIRRGDTICKGPGVTSALLKERGIKIIGF